MPAIYVVLGNANTRKSSVVRALTGVPQRKSVSVGTGVGDIDVFVQVSALQESGIEPAIFINEMANGAFTHILTTLRIAPLRRHGVVLPAGLDYLDAFASAGWHLREIVVLGTTHLQGIHPNYPGPRFAPHSATTPVNRTAADIRAWWGWI